MNDKRQCSTCKHGKPSYDTVGPEGAEGSVDCKHILTLMGDLEMKWEWSDGYVGPDSIKCLTFPKTFGCNGWEEGEYKEETP